jgi:hypothetical protein
MAKFQITHQDMVIDALDCYVYNLKRNNCTEASIEIFSKLLEDFETGKLQVYEKLDYFNGKVSEYNCLALDMRDSENACGRDDKDFDQKEFAEEEEDISFWEYFKGFFIKSWMFG